MSAGSNSNAVKIAIVGMTGSGKTVLVTTLAMKMAQMSLENIFLAPFGSNRRETLLYTQRNWQTLNNGQWPPSTPAGELIELQWELNTKNCQASVQFLDFAGQDIRSLFKTDNPDLYSYSRDLRKVYRSIVSANVLIILVNMKDLLATTDAVSEIVDLDQILHTLQRRSNIPRRMAVAFSQYDKYKPEVDQKFNGNFEEYVNYYLPFLYGQYNRNHNFELIPVAAVNETQNVVVDDEVKQFPKPNFSSYNLETLIHWIADSVEQVAVEIAEEERRLKLEDEERKRREAERKAKQLQREQTLKWRMKVWGVIIVALLLVSFVVLSSIQPPKGSFQWYYNAANKGNADAQYNLGKCYDDGSGVPENKAEAVKWYRKAADQGHNKAQCNLGICYFYGYGVAEDKAEAVEWFLKAANQGNDIAQNNLGVCYKNGAGVDKDNVEAAQWFHKAANQDNADAQNYLGICYEQGLGVDKDEAEAIKWYQKAADQGNDAAKKRLEELEKKNKPWWQIW